MKILKSEIKIYKSKSSYALSLAIGSCLILLFFFAHSYSENLWQKSFSLIFLLASLLLLFFAFRNFFDRTPQLTINDSGLLVNVVDHKRFIKWKDILYHKIGSERMKGLDYNDTGVSFLELKFRNHLSSGEIVEDIIRILISDLNIESRKLEDLISKELKH